MSTNATITVIDRKADTATTIYNHWDGGSIGQILRAYYSTIERALALVALGDVSSLAPSIECPEGHTFENPIKGHSTFYGRDRGEDGTEADVQSLKDFEASRLSGTRCGSQEYNFVFDGEWTQI